MDQKCLNIGLYATFKEILRVFRFALKQILTQILLQEYLCSLYIAIGAETEEKSISDLCQLLLQMAFSNRKTP